MESENIFKNKLSIKNFKKLLRNKKFWKICISVIFWSLIGTFFSIGLCQRIDQRTHFRFLKNHTAVIVSQSMSYSNDVNTYLPEDVEHIYKGDIIKTNPYESFESVQKYDVILYYAANGDMICHRVIEKYYTTDGPYILTRGDANNADDIPIRFDYVRGKVVKIQHNTGNIILFLRSPYFLFSVCGTGFFVFLGFLLANVLKEKSHNNTPKNKSDDKSVKKQKKHRMQKENVLKIVLPFIAIGGGGIFATSYSKASALHYKTVSPVSFTIGGSNLKTYYLITTFKNKIYDWQEWDTGDQKIFAHVWNDTVNPIVAADYKLDWFETVNNVKKWVLVIPSDTYNKILFARVNPSATSLNFNDGTVYNQTEDIELRSDRSTLQMLSWDGGQDGKSTLEWVS